MKIKRFQASNMREAIRLVREEQGPDAVILSNRRIPGGVEVVAATDYDAALMQSAAGMRPEAPQAEASKAVAEAAPAPVAQVVEAPAPRRRIAEQAAEAVEADREELATSRWALLRKPAPRTPAPVAQQAPAPVVIEQQQVLAAGNTAVALSTAQPQLQPQQAPAPLVASEDAQQLNREIQTLRSLLEEQLAGLRWGDMQRRRPRQAAALRALVNLGLDADLARSVAEEVPEGADAERARFLPLGLLARRLPVDAADPILQGGVIALVGPTGVGKTTSIAKLAARYAAQHGVRDIALVTMDHYRIGAPEQLYTYGRLLGVPVHAVGPSESLSAVLSRVSDRKLVLIDTAGLSQRDKAVDGLLKQLKTAGPDLKIWLTLAANAQPGALEEVIQRYSKLPVSSCVLTKLDEAHRIGGALSVAIRHQLRIAYLTDGQRVPEDLQAARADRLVLRAMQLARESAASVDESVLVSGFNSLAHANA